MDTQTVLVTILVAVLGSGALSAFVTSWLNRRNRTAEVESLQVATANKVVELTSGTFDELRTEIAALQLQVLDLERRLNESDADREYLRRQLADLHDHIDDLEVLIRDLGAEPPPRPRTRK